MTGSLAFIREKLIYKVIYKKFLHKALQNFFICAII